MKKKSQFGSLSPQFGFMLNPYPDQRISRCPLCEKKTRQRKKPLLIHVDLNQLVALNYTCRYCLDCDLLIGHKHEIEHLLTEWFRQDAPEIIGNNYLILGTVDKKRWREGLEKSLPIDKIREYVSDFESYYEELRFTRPGYYLPDQEPPIMEPPLSQEWIKNKRVFFP
ncbi:hypothetical protein cce_5141 [Crocosphaera subtropica ATCC 51142]|uniref:Uncharacterized protein n=1 Tax=Crocosphaera subtropica (strain ATCC 51142 / BH68) TaxID=43989 RepID=B1X2X6_CROS5|nr:hypothetical protein [Crocosphaera subtropica]ACB54487.1 hypothetical protein cce_5141 [Crocosphaera subtropica ATCC 51142]